MNLEQVAFLKSFIKILEKAKFEVTAVELLDVANKIQTYSKIVIEMENSMKQLPIENKAAAVSAVKRK